MSASISIHNVRSIKVERGDGGSGKHPILWFEFIVVEHDGTESEITLYMADGKPCEIEGAEFLNGMLQEAP